MNYRLIYNRLTDKECIGYRSKQDNMYYEAHHIKPRCFGGKGDCRNIQHPNIILLTPKEHYIAHLLLTRIYPESPAMWKALWSMCTVDPNKSRYKPSARMYNQIRENYIKAVKGSGNHFFGRKHNQLSLIKIAEASKGRKPNLGKKLSEETRKKMSDARKGKIFITDATKKKISKSMGGGNHYRAIPIMCEKTNKVFGSGKELSEFIGVPFSTVRRWLNGTTNPPSSFHYKRQQLAYDQQ
jgi:hypothetical protein